MRQDRRYYPPEGRYSNPDYVLESVQIDARFRLWKGYIESICQDTHLAEDIESNAFERALCSADTFDPQGDQADGYVCWMSTIIRNELYRYRRKDSKRIKTAPLDAAQYIACEQRHSIDYHLILDCIEQMKPIHIVALLSKASAIPLSSVIPIPRRQRDRLMLKAKSELIRAIASKDLTLLTEIIPSALGMAKSKATQTSTEQTPHKEE